MKTTIYYFTGTGNSLKIAKDLSQRLDECELIPIAKNVHQKDIISRSEKVGIVCPLYFGGLPEIVVDFLEKITFEKTKYIFSVVSRGTARIRGALSQINKLLKEKKKDLNAGFYTYMPGNYIINYDIIPNERQQFLFQKTNRKINRIAQIIKNNKYKIEKEMYLRGALVLNNRFRQKVNNCDDKFMVNENCNSCGICKKICPINNIIIINGNPHWQHRCQLCLACIHFCPQEAIQYGTETINRKRYHHPEITIDDMTNQK